MVALIWFLVALMLLILAWRMLDRREAVYTSALLANFALVVPLAGALTSVGAMDAVCSPVAGSFTALSWGVFSGCIALLTVMLGARNSGRTILSRIADIPGSILVAVGLIWWAATIWVIAAQGFSGFVATRFLESSAADLPYSLRVADLLGTYLLSGALLVAVTKAAVGGLGRWSAGILGLAFAVAAISGGLPVGTRRSVLGLSIVYFAVLYVARGHRVRRLAPQLVVVGMLGVSVFLYFPTVRFNLRDPVTQELLASRTFGGLSRGLIRLAKPDPEPLLSGETSVVRAGVAHLHCRLSDAQWRTPITSEGRVSSDALYIAAPSILAPEKGDKHPDSRLAETFGLYPSGPYLILDLSANPLVQLQADFGAVGWILAAILLVGGFTVAAVVMRLPTSPISRLLACGILWACVATPEADMNQVVTAVRDAVALIVLVEVIRFASRAAAMPRAG